MPCAGTGGGRRLGAAEEEEIEGPEDQDNTDVHEQPLPEQVPEEGDVDSDDEGNHGDEVKHDTDRSVHCGT